MNFESYVGGGGVLRPLGEKKSLPGVQPLGLLPGLGQAGAGEGGGARESTSAPVYLVSTVSCLFGRATVWIYLTLSSGGGSCGAVGRAEWTEGETVLIHITFIVAVAAATAQSG